MGRTTVFMSWPWKRQNDKHENENERSKLKSIYLVWRITQQQNSYFIGMEASSKANCWNTTEFPKDYFTLVTRDSASCRESLSKKGRKVGETKNLECAYANNEGITGDLPWDVSVLDSHSLALQCFWQLGKTTSTDNSDEREFNAFVVHLVPKIVGCLAVWYESLVHGV